MEITIHTGCQGDYNKINVAWSDHNNVPQRTTVEVNVQQQDKPRTLEIQINGLIIATVPAIKLP